MKQVMEGINHNNKRYGIGFFIDNPNYLLTDANGEFQVQKTKTDAIHWLIEKGLPELKAFKILSNLIAKSN